MKYSKDKTTKKPLRIRIDGDNLTCIGKTISLLSKSFNDEVGAFFKEYCVKNSREYFKQDVDFDCFFEESLKYHNKNEINKKYSKKQLSELCKSLFEGMTEKYFTKIGAFSLIDKIIMLYCNGLLDKLIQIGNEEKFLVLPTIVHNVGNKFSSRPVFYEGGLVVDKNGIFCSLRKKSKKCKDDCFSCSLEKMLGSAMGRLFLSFFSQHQKFSYCESSCFSKLYFNSKLKTEYQIKSPVFEDATGKEVKTIPDEIEIYNIKYPKVMFEDVLDIEWALTYLILKFCKLPGIEQGEYVDLYRVFCVKKGDLVPGSYKQRANGSDIWVSTSLWIPNFRVSSSYGYEFFYKSRVEKYLCVFNFIANISCDSLLIDRECEIGMLHVDKEFSRMFKDGNEDVEGVDDEVNGRIKKVFKDFKGGDEWMRKWNIEMLKGNAYCNYKTYKEMEKGSESGRSIMVIKDKNGGNGTMLAKEVLKKIDSSPYYDMKFNKKDLKIAP